jgi:hypothetical protein
MARFCELGVEADVVIGKGIDMEELFNRRILIEKTIIQPTKYPGKNASGLRMQMQVVLATFNPTSPGIITKRMKAVWQSVKGVHVSPGRTFLFPQYRKRKAGCPH